MQISQQEIPQVPMLNQETEESDFEFKQNIIDHVEADFVIKEEIRVEQNEIKEKNELNRSQSCTTEDSDTIEGLSLDLNQQMQLDNTLI